MLCGEQPGDKAYNEALANTEGISPEAHTVIAKACAFEPNARYQSAREFAQALGRPMRSTSLFGP